jgi:hypothetical protein
MVFANNYERDEWLGRQALKKLQSLYPNALKHRIHFTELAYDCFDAYIHITTNYVVTKYIFIEIKIRKTAYPDYILEKKKSDSLNAFIKRNHLNADEYQLLYVNFTPSGTYFWDITTVSTPLTTLSCPSTTSTTGHKVDKRNYMLPTNAAKRFDFIYNETDIMTEAEYKLKLKNTIQPVLKNKGITTFFDD